MFSKEGHPTHSHPLRRTTGRCRGFPGGNSPKTRRYSDDPGVAGGPRCVYAWLRWPFIVTWAGELGMSGQQAVAMCTGEGERADG